MVSEKELEVVRHLRRNARIKLTELSRVTNLPVSTLFDMVRRPGFGGINRMCALLDFQKLGFGACAIMLLKVVPECREKLKAHLLVSEHVNYLIRVNNGFDFVVECVFRNMRELEEFCEKLEKLYRVKGRDVHFVIEELRREGFLVNQGVCYGGA